METVKIRLAYVREGRIFGCGFSVSEHEKDQVEPERRVILSALLLAIAQQVPKNVKWLGVRPSKATELSEVIAFEAREFVSTRGSGFDEMCNHLNVDPERFRAVDPDRAFEAYRKLTSDDYEDLLAVEKEWDGTEQTSGIVGLDVRHTFPEDTQANV